MKEVMTPPANSLHRELYERNFQAGDEGNARYISLGGQIEVVQRQLADSARTPTELADLYYGKYQPWLENYAKTQVDHAELLPGAFGSIVPRIRLLHTALDQMVCAPILFTFGSNRSHAFRQRLIEQDGIYGIMVSAVEEAFANYAPHTFDADIKHTVGFLNEGTALSLLNREQRLEQLALPALPFHDFTRGIDIQTFMLHRGETVVRQLQVKSDEHAHTEPRGTAPKLIGGIALGNSLASNNWGSQDKTKFRTVSEILKDIEGSIADVDELVLSDLAHRLSSAVRWNRNFIHVIQTAISQATHMSEIA
jgi:hypothetical protein